MTVEHGTALELVEMIMLKAPEYLDLLTARSEADFDRAFDSILQDAIERLETNRVNFEALNEVGLTAVVAAGLSIPGFTVTQETHSNGHVDLTVRADHCVPSRTRLGEAKIWDGPAYHVRGVDQLLSRYTTGREGRGLLIVYFRKREIATLIRGLRSEMDTTHPCRQQGATVDHVLKWSFRSTHEHSCGDPVEVAHVGCNLFVDRKSGV